MHQLDLPRSVQLPELMFVYVCLEVLDTIVALCSWQSRGLCGCGCVEDCYQDLIPFVQNCRGAEEAHSALPNGALYGPLW